MSVLKEMKERLEKYLLTMEDRDRNVEWVCMTRDEVGALLDMMEESETAEEPKKAEDLLDLQSYGQGFMDGCEFGYNQVLKDVIKNWEGCSGMAEINRKSVLMECLSIMREELRICSTNYNGLVPKQGMEEAWAQARKKVSILEDLTQAMDCEQVRRVIANWQFEVMKYGPTALKLEGPETNARMTGGTDHEEGTAEH